jgi:hypothetical protein
MGDDKKRKSGPVRKFLLLAALAAAVLGGSKVLAVAMGDPSLDLVAKLLALAGS